MKERYADPKLKIFALNSNRPLAQKIADEVGVELGKLSVDRFSDGEIQINIEESVRGDNVYVIQSTSAPVNDNLMELMIMIDALRRASANTINVVLPYYGYARQDRKARSREPITAKLVANMLQNSGVTRIVALDLHAAQIQGFFDIPVDHLMGAPLLADYLSTRAWLPMPLSFRQTMVGLREHGPWQSFSRRRLLSLISGGHGQTLPRL